MGLLDGLLGNVIGSALGGGGQGANPMLNVVLGMLANGQGGQAGQGGGLGALVQQFQNAGLGDHVNSWIGTGQNMPVSADQVTQALGSDTIGNIAQQLGLGHGDVAGQLSQMLPQIINHVTPQGQAPAGGLGSAGDIMGMLGGLLGKK